MQHTNSNGSVAIVTGGSKGYGTGIAQVLKQAGFTVIITARDGAALRATAQRLGVESVVADVTSPADWDRVTQAALKHTGRIDLLVNNAGGAVRIGNIDEITDDQIIQSVNVNLTGAMLGCKRVVPIMRQQKAGMIVNISSICAFKAWPGWGPYSAAKAGLNQFGHCLFTELRPVGVRVTTITPSWGATDFMAAASIVGHPTDDAAISAKSMQPAEMGEMVLSLWNMPSHLVVPDVHVQPMVQEVVPM